MEDLCKPIKVGGDGVHIQQIRMGPNWMDSSVLFLKKDVLRENKFEADKVQRKATSYWLSENHKLHKHSFSGPYLLCVHPD